MKVFLSWSGDRSKAVAELLNDWIKCVLQATRPWISTKEIERGALWFNTINDQLKDVSVGIVCLTKDNKDRPWILFEAGALAKGLSTSRVCTFLVDLSVTDIEDPLAQFNHTHPDNSGMWELVRTLNASLVEGALEERILRTVFGTYWPQFEAKFAVLLKNTPEAKASAPRPQSELFSEMLESNRAILNRLSRLENRLAPTVQETFASTDQVREKLRVMRDAGASKRQASDYCRSIGLPLDTIPSFVDYLYGDRVRDSSEPNARSMDGYPLS